MTCKTTYTTLLKMRQNALWATEMAHANGLHHLAIRYYKILNRIEKSMWNYPSSNEFKTAKRIRNVKPISF